MNVLSQICGQVLIAQVSIAIVYYTLIVSALSIPGLQAILILGVTLIQKCHDRCNDSQSSATLPAS